MARWRIKEMSDLTKVSVRMLRHYDAIGLLKPSMRSSSNYRYYSENDLITLQQIIALRFFNFDLNQVKAIVQQQKGIREHLLVQMDMLQSQSDHLVNAQKAIKEVLRRLPDTGIPNWSDLISLIEGYRMAEERKKTWVAKILNKQQFEKYTGLYQHYPKELEAWEKLITEINEMNLGEPEGPEGERAVKAFIDITKKTRLSHSEQRQLNADIIRSIKEEEIPLQSSVSYLPLSSQGSMWVAKASSAYWLKRWESLYQDIVKNLDTDPIGEIGKNIANEWRSLISEQLMVTSPDLTIGVMLWGEAAKNKIELQEQEPSTYVQDTIKKIQVGLVFNPKALQWIEKALNTH